MSSKKRVTAFVLCKGPLLWCTFEIVELLIILRALLPEM